MAKAGCTGPLCKFTGANGKSEAAAGRCTNARGYLANAEINEIISKSKGKPKTWYDKDTASDYLVYNGKCVSHTPYALPPFTRLDDADQRQHRP